MKKSAFRPRKSLHILHVYRTIQTNKQELPAMTTAAQTETTYTEYVTASVARTARAIRALGLTARHLDGEWRVALPGKNQEASAYYTSDNADAYHTAHHMAAEARRNAGDAS
jgi:hypothetical protein